VIVNGSPQELSTTGGTGSTCASPTHETVDPSSAGKVNVGGNIVYVYVHSPDVPVQFVYVHVYVFVPEHVGSGPMTGPVMVIGSPQELSTDGGVGIAWASLTHATVDPPLAGRIKVG